MKSLRRHLIYLLLPTGALALSSCTAIPKFDQTNASSLGEKLADSVPQNQLAPTPTESWRVVKVADGDTITVVRGSQKEKIRFCGIDAPETKHGRSPGQPLGQESKANLQRLIDEANGEVQLSIVELDRYGRSVAEVFTVLEDGSVMLSICCLPLD